MGDKLPAGLGLRADKLEAMTKDGVNGIYYEE